MALTRANIETILIQRTGALLTLVSLDGTTVDGTNASLNDPIGYGIRQSGGSTSNFASVSDADVLTVDTTSQDQLIDIAEFRTLQNVLGNYNMPNTKVGPRDEEWGDLGEVISDRLDKKQKLLEELYGFGSRALEGGIIAYDFAEHDFDNVDEEGW
jgi:hypothetical protein